MTRGGLVVVTFFLLGTAVVSGLLATAHKHGPNNCPPSKKRVSENSVEGLLYGLALNVLASMQCDACELGDQQKKPRQVAGLKHQITNQSG